MCSFEVLTATCAGCGAPAPFSAKLEGDLRTKTAVGGKGMYAAVCRACYAKMRGAAK